MSTLQVSNVHLESTANNRLQYAGSNTVNLYVGGTKVIDSNSSTFAITGNVGIGNTAPALDLYVNGSSAGAIGTLTDAANVAVDLSTFNNYSITLGGNRNIDNPTNLQPGQSGVIFITQDGTGSRTLSWSSYWKFSGNTAPTLTTTGGSVDAILYVVRTSTSITAQSVLNVG